MTQLTMLEPKPAPAQFAEPGPPLPVPAVIPVEKVRTVLMDPAWAFTTYSKKNQDRAAENHYQCMTLEDMYALPVADVMAKDSVCLLWVTNPFMAYGFEMMSRYGFKYKTCLTWLKHNNGKVQQGTGYHLRGATEHMLIGTKGKGFCPPPALRLPSGFLAPRTLHSAKPEEQYQYAENYQPPYLELYARRPRTGWVSLGNEIDGRDLRDSLPALASYLNGETK